MDLLIKLYRYYVFNKMSMSKKKIKAKMIDLPGFTVRRTDIFLRIANNKK